MSGGKPRFSYEMISKTQITKRTEKKQNPHIIETIALAKKNNLLELAKKLSSPKSNYTNINLEELNKIEENSIIVVGKVLGSGNINKKITISALAFSKQAHDKLKKAQCEIKTITEEITKNKSLSGVKII